MFGNQIFENKKKIDCMNNKTKKQYFHPGYSILLKIGEKIAGLLSRDMLSLHCICHTSAKVHEVSMSLLVLFFSPWRVCRDAAEYYRHKAWPSVHGNPLPHVPELHPVHSVPKGGGSCHHGLSVGALRGLYPDDPLLSWFLRIISVIHFFLKSPTSCNERC